MLTISKLQRNCIYLFAFSINFETANLFNIGIDYLASKITIVILLIVTLFNLQALKTIKNYLLSISSLLFFFLYLTVISFLNRGGSSISFIYFPFLLNILIMLIILSVVKRFPTVLFNSLIAFSIGTFLTSVLFVLNIGVNLSSDGRITIFNLNENMLGLNAAFAIFTFIYFTYQHKPIKKKLKFLMLIIIAFLFLLLVKTGSRGAFLSFVFGIILFLFSKKDTTILKKVLIMSGLLILGIIVWFVFLKNSVLTERLVTSVNDGDLSNRDLIWISLFDLIVNNYWFGVGITGYEKIVGNGSPHNVLIEVLCYSGISGLIIFITFIIKIGKGAYRNYKIDYNVLPIVIFVSTFGMILTGQIFEQKIFWVLFAYLIASNKSKPLIINKTRYLPTNNILTSSSLH